MEVQVELDEARRTIQQHAAEQKHDRWVVFQKMVTEVIFQCQDCDLRCIVSTLWFTAHPSDRIRLAAHNRQVQGEILRHWLDTARVRPSIWQRRMKDD